MSSTTTIQEQLVSQIARDIQCVKSLPAHALLVLRLLMTDVPTNCVAVNPVPEAKQVYTKQFYARPRAENHTSFPLTRQKKHVYSIHQPRSNQLGFKKNHRKS